MMSRDQRSPKISSEILTGQPDLRFVLGLLDTGGKVARLLAKCKHMKRGAKEIKDPGATPAPGAPAGVALLARKGTGTAAAAGSACAGYLVSEAIECFEKRGEGDGDAIGVVDGGFSAGGQAGDGHGHGDAVILKAITPPKIEDFQEILSQARAEARKAKIRKADLKPAIARVSRGAR